MTDAVFVVTVLPPASSTVTSGWELNAVPVPSPARVKTSWVAEPAVMVKVALVARERPVRRGSVCLVAALLIEQPVKVATPADAATGLWCTTRVAPAGVVMREGHLRGVGGHGVAAGVLDGDDRLGGEGVPPVPLLG